MTYEQLVIEADNSEVEVIEKKFKSNAKGLCKGSKIAISCDINNCEKKCILAEELGHYYTTVGDILDQKSISNMKQEHKARVWAYNKLIRLSDLRQAYNAGYRTTYEMAEILDVDEKFLKDSLEYYSIKYGTEFLSEIDGDLKTKILCGPDIKL
ncbi:ImmA/IrrE family metallo-endopeptidase [Anaerovorax odorimutans]|uniref:ImmA/IrrE family metallo-endopeptidase n=1 Tax=Anaerovorax odorimutans TaxID=109327 RepID=UPI0004032007|nr:hypothetical protein [Anaerovorax odorimutans]